MSQTYKRKTNRAFRTSLDVLRRAAEEVENGSSLRKAAANFNIDKMTLSRYVNKCKLQPQPVTDYDAVVLSNFAIPPAMESDLAQHIKTLNYMFYGLAIEKCKQVAYEFATRNKLKVPSSWVEKKKAGKSWWLGFKSRHNLSVCSPEPTSLGLAFPYNKFTVKEFFDNLAKVLNEYKFTAQQIFNVDETGLTTVQNPGEIATTRGVRNVGSVTSAERGELVTAVYTICASGSVLPPAYFSPCTLSGSFFQRRTSRLYWTMQQIWLDK